MNNELKYSSLNTVSTNRRRFLQAAGAGALAGIMTACGGRDKKISTPEVSQELADYIATLPRDYGGTTWTGVWKVENTDTAKAIMQTYYDQSGALRHRILEIIIADHTREGTPITLEQQKVLAKKESYGNLCSHEYLDTQLVPTLPPEKMANLHVLVDGLAFLALTPEEQMILNVGYTDPMYNYNEQGKPYYRDPLNQSKSMINGLISWNCESKITPAMIAAVDILSTRQKIILEGGVRVVGAEIINRYYQN